MTRPSWQDFGTHDESAHPQLWDGVVGAWCPSLGPTGSRLHDMSGRSNWGTLQNASVLTDWQMTDGQYAINFDGTDNNVRIDRNVLENPSQTATAWVKAASFPSAYNTVICKDEAVTRYWTLLVKSNGKLAYYVYASGNVSADGTGLTTLTAGRWYFLAMSYSEVAGLAGYVNGIRDATAAASGSPTTGSTFANIGSHFQALTGGSSGRYFNGQIDDIRVYDRVLTLNEIQELYRLGRAGTYERKRRTLRRYRPEPPLFQPYWALNRNQTIGGGLR
jgi:hypothetical protein